MQANPQLTGRVAGKQVEDTAIALVHQVPKHQVQEYQPSIYALLQPSLIPPPEIRPKIIGAFQSKRMTKNLSFFLQVVMEMLEGNFLSLI